MKQRAHREFYTRENGTTGVRVKFLEKSLVRPEFKESSDVNKILAQYIKTGQRIPELYRGRYADVANIQDLQGSLSAIAKAEEYFNALPSSIRNKFANDPTQMISFLQDPKNLEEAISLGMVEKPQQLVQTGQGGNNESASSKDSSKPG